MRKTNLVIKEIKELVKEKGYIYSLCLILFEDFHIIPEKSHEINAWSRLNINEASMLLGFLIQDEINFTEPKSWKDLIQLKKKTYDLMKELHESLKEPFLKELGDIFEKQQNGKEVKLNEKSFFGKGDMLKEPIFYSGDGVYDIQYLEFLEKKYKYDIEWLLKNKNFNLAKSKEAILEIKSILEEKSKKVNFCSLKETFPETVKKMSKKLSAEELKKQSEEVLPMIELFQYINLFLDDLKNKDDLSLDDIREESWKCFYRNLLDLFIVDISKFDKHFEINNFMKNFSIAPKKDLNSNFETIGDYNLVNSHPIIKIDDKKYFIPITFLLSQAIYESPFYWMSSDKNYTDLASKNRGDVGEEITYDLLLKVFGKERIFKSVKITTKKGIDDTDIDVLCILGNKALCVQIKSKKLTTLSRRGGDIALISDFQKAVQEAYGQGLISRKKILERDAKFIGEDGNEIKLPEGIEEVYLMGITTENYPSLTHQTDVMLDKKEDEPFPLVMTVFDLDLISHYLPDPYDLLYYVKQRISLMDYFKGEEEMAFLGHHLVEKLWTREGTDREMLDASLGQLIDRNYYPYKLGLKISDEGDAIKNRWKSEKFEQLCNELKEFKEPKITDTLFYLFDWSEGGREDILKFINKTKTQTLKDGQLHDFSIISENGGKPVVGLTYFSLNSNNPEELRKRLVSFCQIRKYKSKANVWMGLGSLKDSPRMIDAVTFNNSNWNYNEDLEKASKFLSSGENRGKVVKIGRKVGRNEKCPCGSGLKYKKCCLEI